MARKPTGRPNGRPRLVQADVAAAGVAAGRTVTADAARAAKVSPATVKRRLAERRAGKGAPAASAPAARAPTAPPTSDRRTALLALLADALTVDLVAALPLDVAELGRRLADAGLLDGDLDPLAILGRVQGRLERDMATLGADQVAARKGVAQTLTSIASTAERIKLGRPAETEAPEVLAARIIAGQRDAAVAKIFEHVEARAA